MTNNKPNVSLEGVLGEAIRDAVELSLRRVVSELKAHISECTGGRKISVAEAADRMGVSQSHAWTMVRSGELRSSRMGKRVLIDPTDLPQAKRDERDAEDAAAKAVSR